MATAEELLRLATTAPEDEILTVDPNTRVISIPAAITVLGVESDDDVKRLHFSMPRYYGEFDLSEFAIRVNFENASHSGDFYDVEDKTITEDGDTIAFSWLVDRHAFEREGDVIFSICLKLYNDAGEVIKEWNTTTAKLKVLEGLETSESIESKNPSILDSILFRLYAVEAANELGRDGHYSIVKVSESDQGVMFTIIDQDGAIEAIVRHGHDGYIPILGVDYWTEAQQLEIKNQAANYAKSYVDSWAPKTQTIVISASGWEKDSKRQSVNYPGMTGDLVVVVAPVCSSNPNEDYYDLYAEHKIRCMGQYTNILRFQCDEIPEKDIKANVITFYNKNDSTGRITVSDDGKGNVTIM